MYTLLTFHSLLNLVFTYYLGENSDYKDYNEINEHYSNYQLRLNPYLQPMYEENDNSRPVNYGFLRPLRGKPEYPTELPSVYSLNMTFFPQLSTAQNEATEVKNDAAPWIAKVIVSNYLLCTASCIEPNIFVTAARCIAQQKIKYIQVSYKNNKLAPVAFVMPSQGTKTMFDDIGFIVTNFTNPSKTFWDTTEQHHIHRNDTYFEWFNEWRMGIVYGYVADPQNKVTHYLYKLNVIMSSFLCQNIYKPHSEQNGYFVPCFHSCDLTDDYLKDPICKKYLGGDGHAVLVNKKLIGISTWGFFDASFERNHPVGMAVINSHAYKIDYQCAKKIRDALEAGSSEIPVC